MNFKCPKCGHRGLVAYNDEADSFRVYLCTKCKKVYHPPGCRCRHCPRPRLK